MALAIHRLRRGPPSCRSECSRAFGAARLSATSSEQASSASVGVRIKELDGYRGVAVLSIVLYHYVVLQLQVEPGTAMAYAQKYLQSLWVGVDAFFVLSGFLIGGILLDKKESTNLFEVFYLRRALRIFPPYVMLLICWAAVSPISHLPGMSWLLEPESPTWPYIFYVQNFWMAVRGGFGPNLVAATWSLAIEEQFYLLFPLAIRLTSRWALPLLLGIGALLAPTLRLGLAFLGSEWKQALIVLLPLRWDSLLLGAGIAWVVREPALMEWVRANKKSATRLLLLLSAWMVLLPFVVESPDWVISPWRAFVVFLAIAGFFALTLLLLKLGELRTIASILSGRTLRFFGKISYFLYLFHTAFLGLAFVLVGNKSPVLRSWQDWGVMLLAFVLCVTIAELSWRTIEAPLVRLGHGFAYSRPTLSGKEVAA